MNRFGFPGTLRCTFQWIGVLSAGVAKMFYKCCPTFYIYISNCFIMIYLIFCGLKCCIRCKYRYDVWIIIVGAYWIFAVNTDGYLKI
jgi:hypothetical protein